MNTAVCTVRRLYLGATLKGNGSSLPRMSQISDLTAVLYLLFDVIVNSVAGWSGHMPSLWSPFCYKRDHSQAEAMWKKPSELTKYNSSGFEVSFWSSHGADAHGALRGWRGSKSHDDIIAEKDAWAGVKWPAMGCGLYKGGAILEVLDGTGLFFERDVQKLIREIAITDSLSRFPSSLLPAIFTNSEAAHCWFGKVKDSDGWPDVCDENS